MADRELKPCPFCGNNAHISPEGGDAFNGTFNVNCSACDCKLEWIKTEELAVFIWNHRQPDTELVEALGMDGPWNLLNCAKALVLAAIHLQDVHNCDTHGYENVGTAVRMMQKHIPNLEKALAKLKEKE